MTTLFTSFHIIGSLVIDCNTSVEFPSDWGVAVSGEDKEAIYLWLRACCVQQSCRWCDEILDSANELLFRANWNVQTNDIVSGAAFCLFFRCLVFVEGGARNTIHWVNWSENNSSYTWLLLPSLSEIKSFSRVKAVFHSRGFWKVFGKWVFGSVIEFPRRQNFYD